MQNLAEILEKEDFEYIVLWAGGKYLKRLGLSKDELCHEVRVGMWKNLHNKSPQNINSTTLTIKHTLYTVFRIFKERKIAAIKRDAQSKYVRESKPIISFEDIDNQDSVEELIELGKLDNRIKSILFRRLKGETLDEIAQDLKLSKERIRQIENSAILKIKKGYKHNYENNLSRC